MFPIPLQFGLPELLIVFFTFGILFLVPTFVAFVVYQAFDARKGYEARIEELEAEVDALRRRVDEGDE